MLGFSPACSGGQSPMSRGLSTKPVYRVCRCLHILLREWVITFIFFPIMRGKKWLFVAILSSLMASGILHLLPRFFDDQIPWFGISSSLSYWFLNGLAIYAA